MTKPDAYEKAWCQALTDVVFEGEIFKAPAEYDKFLTTLYGDYMQLPPEDQRVGHGIKAWRVTENEK